MHIVRQPYRRTKETQYLLKVLKNPFISYQPVNHCITVMHCDNLLCSSSCYMFQNTITDNGEERDGN